MNLGAPSPGTQELVENREGDGLVRRWAVWKRDSGVCTCVFLGA